MQTPVDPITALGAAEAVVGAAVETVVTIDGTTPATDTDADANRP